MIVRVGGLGDITDNLFPGVPQWGVLEWGLVLIGGYVLYSVYSTTTRQVQRVKRRVHRRQATTHHRQALLKQIEGL